ncbi:hypothetical protein LHGZ1_1492 [Laribacter hongkongensis]|uniref:Uncharacterized protein n=1 Tax=Laribacter hongkongensis TaxID=168471 RepID=A0A248LJH4_9NEIS|nr:hypothetical protein LHGZ1_1492 [Laribacter hongkongensis]
MQKKWGVVSLCAFDIISPIFSSTATVFSRVSTNPYPISGFTA